MAWGIDAQSRSVIHVYSVDCKRKEVRLKSEIFVEDRQSINQVSLSHNVQTLALGSTSENLRVFSAFSWQEQYSFDQAMPELTAQNTGELINIYKEVNTKTDGSYYEALQRPFELGRVKSQKGMLQIALSGDSKFCATVCATTPRCVWVWDLTDYNLNSILVQEHDVSDLSWCPRSNNLNISTRESSKLYLWSPKGASVC